MFSTLKRSLKCRRINKLYNKIANIDLVKLPHSKVPTLLNELVNILTLLQNDCDYSPRVLAKLHIGFWSKDIVSLLANLDEVVELIEQESSLKSFMISVREETVVSFDDWLSTGDDMVVDCNAGINEVVLRVRKLQQQLASVGLAEPETLEYFVIKLWRLIKDVISFTNALYNLQRGKGNV